MSFLLHRLKWFSSLILLTGLTGLLCGQSAKTYFEPAQEITVSANELSALTLSPAEETLLDESFEGDLTGWSYIDNDGDGNYWSLYEEDATYDVAHTGTYGLGVYYNAAGNDDYIITPQLALPADASSITFSFWAHSHSTSYLEDFNVKLSTSGTSITDFSVTLESVTDVPSSWTQYTYDLTDFAGESVYLTVQCVSVDDWYLFADDFLVTAETGGSSLTADFTADVTSGAPPLTVNFTDQSTGATSWDWDFGDGNSSTDQNPSHTYQANGSYTVSLTVSDGTEEATETKSGYITVNEPTDEPGGWFMQSPYPTASDIKAVEYIDNSTAVAVGAVGLILRTTDAGQTWETISSGTNESLRDVDFPSPTTGYIVGAHPGYGEPGTMLKTTDGGATWTALTINFNYDVRSVSFVDENTGWIAGEGSYSGNGSISKTTDGGANWVSQDAGFADNYRSVYFLDANTGWVGGWDYTAWTTDGGDSWTPVEIVSTDGVYVTDLQFADESTGYFAGVNHFFKSTDGGQSWEEVTNYPVSTSLEIFFRDANTGWVSSHNIVRYTTDGGDNWTNVLGVPEDIQDMVFDGEVNWVVTEGGRIYKYADDQWSESSSATLPRETIKDAIFIDESTGWAVGYMDNIWATTNGGITWSEQETPAHYALEGVDFVNANTGWAVGDAPYNGEAKIYHTSDGGATWTEQTSGTENLLWDVDFTDANTGWAVGYQGTIIHTGDGGANWSVQTSGTSVTLEEVFFLDASTGWACGQDGTILQTADGGNSWNAQSTPDDRNLYSIHFTDSNTGFAVGAQAMIIGTTDGGSSWSFINEGGSFSDTLYNSINFSEADHGWIAGNDGLVLATKDGGATWTRQQSQTTVDLNAVWFVNNQTGWAVGENGALMKTSTGGEIPVGIEPESGDNPAIAESYVLYQNYPNPFNPVTTIQCNIPNATDLQITVYDLLGKKLDVLFSGYAAPGQYQFQWDASRYSSGMYFVRMVTPEYSAIQKLTLLK